MNKRVVIELDKSLMEGEILLYKGGMIQSIEIHQLLPDLAIAKRQLNEAIEQIEELKQTVANLAKIVKEK